LNNLNLDYLVEKLSESLKGELPGKRSHEKMSATAVSGQRLKFRKNENVKHGAVLILFYEVSGNVHFVLTQRPEYNGTHGGQVSFPGGKREEHDLDLESTALREAEEEIGINRSAVNVIGSFHQVLPVVAYTSKDPDFVRDTFEVAEILSIPLEHLLDDNRLKTKVLEVGEGKFKLNAPYFDLSDKVVWGATAGMLSELKDVLGQIRSWLLITHLESFRKVRQLFGSFVTVTGNCLVFF